MNKNSLFVVTALFAALSASAATQVPETGGNIILCACGRTSTHADYCTQLCGGSGLQSDTQRAVLGPVKKESDAPVTDTGKTMPMACPNPADWPPHCVYSDE